MEPSKVSYRPSNSSYVILEIPERQKTKFEIILKRLNQNFDRQIVSFLFIERNYQNGDDSSKKT